MLRELLLSTLITFVPVSAGTTLNNNTKTTDYTVTSDSTSFADKVLSTTGEALSNDYSIFNTENLYTPYKFMRYGLYWGKMSSTTTSGLTFNVKASVTASYNNVTTNYNYNEVSNPIKDISTLVYGHTFDYSGTDENNIKSMSVSITLNGDSNTFPKTDNYFINACSSYARSNLMSSFGYTLPVPITLSSDRKTLSFTINTSDLRVLYSNEDGTPIVNDTSLSFTDLQLYVNYDHDYAPYTFAVKNYAGRTVRVRTAVGLPENCSFYIGNNYRGNLSYGFMGNGVSGGLGIYNTAGSFERVVYEFGNASYTREWISSNTNITQLYATTLKASNVTSASPTVNRVYFDSTEGSALHSTLYLGSRTPPSVAPSGDIVDIPRLLFTVITLPFTFISQAFNVTLFPNTPYAVNVSNLMLGIIAVIVIFAIIKLIIGIMK